MMLAKAWLVYCSLVAAALVTAGCTKTEDRKQASEDRSQNSGSSTQEAATPAFQEASQPSALPPVHPDINASTQAFPPVHPDISMSTQALSASAAADAPNPQWTVPAGWQEGQSSAMRRATFALKGDDGQAAEVAVSSLPGDAGGLLANVNRWRSQFGLGPLTPDQVAAVTADVDIDGMKVTLVDFQTDTTPAGKTHPQGMIVAILAHEGNSWFFKMTGDAPLVGSQKEELLQFVKSMKF
jgi:hypothetical protein